MVFQKVTFAVCICDKLYRLFAYGEKKIHIDSFILELLPLFSSFAPQKYEIATKTNRGNDHGTVVSEHLEPVEKNRELHPNLKVFENLFKGITPVLHCLLPDQHAVVKHNIKQQLHT